MARNTRFKTKRLIIILIVGVTILSACRHHTKDDFVGEWRAETGNSYVYLHEDGTASGRFEPDVLFHEQFDTHDLESGQISLEKFNQLKNDPVIFDRATARWGYKNEESTGRWKIGIWDYYATPRSLNTSLWIGGSGLFRNKAPFFIFRYIGDPDEYNLFKFKKVEK